MREGKRGGKNMREERRRIARRKKMRGDIGGS